MSTPMGAPPPGAKKSNTWIIFAVIGGVACLGCGGVGLLAAIAVPNFLQFSCKAKQSEAKTNLAGLFTAEKAFYGEYGFYTSDLVSANWAPYERPVYVYGFANAGPDDLTDQDRAQLSGYDDSRKDSANPKVQQAMSFDTSKMVDSYGSRLDASSLPSDTGVERDRFLAGAAGNIDRDATLDVWTIDQQKTVTNTGNDCAN